MKYITIICTVVLVSCHNTNLSKVEGIYTASYENEFANTADTLCIKKVNQSDNIYHLERRSGVVRKLDVRVFPKEMMEASWVLEYLPDKQLFTALNKEKILVWNSQEQTILMGNNIYHLLK